MSGFDIRIQRTIDAAPEAVFQHWVDPVARRDWYAPEEGWIVEAETDLRDGGAWSVSFGPTPEEQYRDEGVFEIVDRPHRLVYTVIMRFPDAGSFETRLTVTFQATPEGRTLLTLLDSGYPTEGLRDGHASGWPDFLNAFQLTLAGQRR